MAAALAALAAAFAQAPALLTPAPIAFAPWRQVERPDTAILEYVEEFPSAYVSGVPENDTVPLRIFLPAETKGPVPVVLVTHYWGASDLRAERALGEDLVGRGIAAAVLTLPYHLSRTPKGRRSGELAITPDIPRLRSTIVQAVLDVRRSLDFLDSRAEFTKSPRGISGTSLGALVAGLGYGVDPRLTHAAFVLGGADFAGILWNSSLTRNQRGVLRAKGYDETRLRAELKDVEPLTYLPRETPGTTLLVSAKYDTVVPGGNSAALARALGDPLRLQIDTGHYGGIFVQRKILGEVSRFFGNEMTGKAYVAPRRIVAPTFRLGAFANYPNGFDLAAGLDVWRLNDRADVFSTLMVTAHGPQLFLGRSIAPGLSIGAFGSLRGRSKLSIGAFWSAVL